MYDERGKKMFEIFDNNQNKLTCKVLFTFNKNNKNFIVYSDQEDEILASYFKIDGEKTIIYPITDDNDFDIIDEELEKRMKYDDK